MKNLLSWLSSYVDSFLRRASSRKFLVFATATYLVFAGKIDGWVWFWVAVAYMGTNILKHFLEAWHDVKLAQVEAPITFKMESGEEPETPTRAVGFRPPQKGGEDE